MTANAARKIVQFPTAQGRNIITIASGKGGVGKTWFATTLAHAFARHGERVLLIDGDLGLANVDVQLGVMPQWDLSAVMSGRVRLSQAIHAYDDGGFDILAGRSGSGVLSTVGREKLLGLRKAIHKIAARYDRVLIDLGAGIDATVRLLMGGNGTILAVTNSEPTALTDAYAFIKVARMKYPTANVQLVVNNAATMQDGPLCIRHRYSPAIRPRRQALASRRCVGAFESRTHERRLVVIECRTANEWCQPG